MKPLALFLVLLLQGAVSSLQTLDMQNDDNALTQVGAGYAVLTPTLTHAYGNAHHHQPHISRLDVTCELSTMVVALEFDAPFDGVVYSKGHFYDQRCRYVAAGTNRSAYTFQIPLDGCGTTPGGGFGRTVDNVIVIQSDDTVQEIWDTARKLSCATTDRKEKTVIFRPFVVDMLEVVTVPEATGSVDCWMDIQRGVFPNTAPIEEIIKIGETLTILVYIKDNDNQYDVRVRDCWAYDHEEYEAKDTHRLQLTDDEGCPKKRKLIGYWQRTHDTGSSGASIIAYNNISAFKFSDRMQVFLTCNIEICFGECEGRCQGGPEPPIPVTTTIRPTPRPRPPPTTVTFPRCYPGSPDPRCPKPTTPVDDAQPPPRCYPGSTDPRCPRPTRPPTAPPTYLPPSTQPPTRPPTTQRPTCYRGSVDARCPQTPPTPRPTIQAQRCYPGSNDPRCPRPQTTTLPPRCYPGSNDTRCPPPPTTETPTLTTIILGPKCVPGTNDPRCPLRPLEGSPIGSPPPLFDSPSQPSGPKCPPGTTNPRCPRRRPAPSQPR